MLVRSGAPRLVRPAPRYVWHAVHPEDEKRRAPGRAAGGRRSSRIQSATSPPAAVVGVGVEPPQPAMRTARLKRSPARTPVCLLAALRRLEENGELVQPLVAERLELRHGRTRVDARRALQVPDLEVDTETRRTDVRQVRRTEVRRARAEVCM